MIRTVMTVVAFGVATIAQAQGTEIAFGTVQQDTSLPVEVSADALSVSQNDGSALFTGNVIIGQGEMRLSARSKIRRKNSTPAPMPVAS